MGFEHARQCTAISKQTGQRCQNPAATGYNVCRHHGAGNVNKGKKGGRPIVHGLYSGKVNTELSDLYENFMEEKQHLTSLTDDIALMRALVVQALEDSPNNESERRYQRKVVLDMLSDIRDTISLKDSIDSQYMVSIEQVKLFLSGILKILEIELRDDPDKLEKVVTRISHVKLLDNQHDERQKQISTKKKRIRR